MPSRPGECPGSSLVASTVTEASGTSRPLPSVGRFRSDLEPAFGARVNVAAEFSPSGPLH